MRRPTLSSKVFAPFAAMLGIALFAADPVSAQQITLVSSASDGTPGNFNNSFDGSTAPSISADGRFVAFISQSTNLVSGDTNGVPDVFVKDRLNGTTTRVSVATGGGQATDRSGITHISGDGRFVAFESTAALVPEDTSTTCGILPQFPLPCSDVYLHDRQTGTTTMLSVSTNGTQGNHHGYPIDISADGRFVLFYSAATNLVSGDTNDIVDLFLRDREAGTTTRVSLDLAGNQLAAGALIGRMSTDARFVVYASATDFGKTVYQYERATGAVSVLSTAFPARDLPPQFTESNYVVEAISHDGEVIAIAEGTNTPPTEPARARYFLFHRQTAHSVATPWRPAGTSLLGYINQLSGDGRVAARVGVNGTVVLSDRVNGLEETVPTTEQNELFVVSLSFDGRFTAFSTTTGSQTGQQVYVYDRDSGDGDGMPSGWETLFGLDPANLTDASADADLDGVTNLQEYLRGTHPAAVAVNTRYFAEGAANSFFTTRMAAINPTDDAAAVVFRFLGSGGHTSSLTRTIAARSRITVELPANGPTPSNDFSTVIESNRLVVVDRTMTWDGTGYGAHAETALLAPSTTWHLAEGATHGAFDLFYLLQNPNDSMANVTINYLRQAPLGPVTKVYAVDANSRRTIPVDGEGPELEAVDTAASITSNLPIVVERAMYSTRPGQPSFAAGHGAAGVTAPALRWFLAEGATGDFFDTFVLIGNPNTTQSELKVTYLLPTGAPFDKTYSVGPQQRLTINVHDEDARLENTAVSVIVESTNNQPVVVERAMWWPRNEWYEAHVSAGATTTGTRWALADGETGFNGSRETYILIANTSTTAGTATVTFLPESGTPVAVIVDLPPSSRVNVPATVHVPAPSGLAPRRFGALIETNGVEIVVERAMYSSTGGITWSAGTAALGTKLQ